MIEANLGLDHGVGHFRPLSITRQRHWLTYNWLQVLGATELAQIDQRVGQQLHAIVPLLDTFKAEQ